MNTMKLMIDNVGGDVGDDRKRERQSSRANALQDERFIRPVSLPQGTEKRR